MPKYNPLEDEHCRIYGDYGKYYGKHKSKAHAVLAPGRPRVMKPQPSVERPNPSIV